VDVEQTQPRRHHRLWIAAVQPLHEIRPRVIAMTGSPSLPLEPKMQETHEIPVRLLCRCGIVTDASMLNPDLRLKLVVETTVVPAVTVSSGILWVSATVRMVAGHY
jgi:hypothetical protein